MSAIFATVHKVERSEPAMKKKKEPAPEPPPIDLSLPPLDVDEDPGLAAMLVGKALAMLGELPGCKCYMHLKVVVAKDDDYCKHVMAFAERELLDHEDPKIRKEHRASQQPPEPTDTEPGTKARKRILRDRIKKHLACDHDLDRKQLWKRPILKEERQDSHE